MDFSQSMAQCISDELYNRQPSISRQHQYFVNDLLDSAHLTEDEEKNLCLALACQHDNQETGLALKSESWVEMKEKLRPMPVHDENTLLIMKSIERFKTPIQLHLHAARTKAEYDLTLPCPQLRMKYFPNQAFERCSIYRGKRGLIAPQETDEEGA